MGFVGGDPKFLTDFRQMPLVAAGCAAGLQPYAAHEEGRPPFLMGSPSPILNSKSQPAETYNPA